MKKEENPNAEPGFFWTFYEKKPVYTGLRVNDFTIFSFLVSKRNLALSPSFYYCTMRLPRVSAVSSSLILVPWSPDFSPSYRPS